MSRRNLHMSGQVVNIEHVCKSAQMFSEISVALLTVSMQSAPRGLRQPVCLHIPLSVFHMLHSQILIFTERSSLSAWSCVSVLL